MVRACPYRASRAREARRKSPIRRAQAGNSDVERALGIAPARPCVVDLTPLPWRNVLGAAADFVALAGGLAGHVGGRMSRWHRRSVAHPAPGRRVGTNSRRARSRASAR